MTYKNPRSSSRQPSNRGGPPNATRTNGSANRPTTSDNASLGAAGGRYLPSKGMGYWPAPSEDGIPKFVRTQGLAGKDAEGEEVGKGPQGMDIDETRMGERKKDLTSGEETRGPPAKDLGGCWTLYTCVLAAPNGSGGARAGILLFPPRGWPLQYTLDFTCEVGSLELEYEASILGMGIARTAGVSHLAIRVGSQELAEQLRGKRKAGPERLRPYQEKARSLYRGFLRSTATWALYAEEEFYEAYHDAVNEEAIWVIREERGLLTTQASEENIGKIERNTIAREDVSSKTGRKQVEVGATNPSYTSIKGSLRAKEGLQWAHLDFQERDEADGTHRQFTSRVFSHLKGGVEISMETFTRWIKSKSQREKESWKKSVARPVNEPRTSALMTIT